MRGLLFDFDGVTVDSMQLHYEGWRAVLASYGHTLRPEDFFIYEGAGVPQIARYLNEKFHLGDEAVLREIGRRVRAHYKGHPVRFFDGFHKVIQLLKDHGLPRAVVTGGSRERVMRTLVEHLNGVFDAVVTLDDVRRSKPHPEPFLKGAEKLGLPPEACLVLENAPLGIQAARAAGCPVWAIQTTLPAHALQEADFVARDFHEIYERLQHLILSGGKVRK
ncbi:MAG: HAD family phosphatase [Calditrichaeota bacterium]|nr:MAG: HAD family phosphatase [Calditrichota bacterium]